MITKKQKTLSEYFTKINWLISFVLHTFDKTMTDRRYSANVTNELLWYNGLSPQQQEFIDNLKLDIRDAFVQRDEIRTRNGWPDTKFETKEQISTHRMLGNRSKR